MRRVTSSQAKPTTRTAEQILDVAERLAQTRGFNGFSYADVSDELGITKASLHYHFRTKAELGRQLIARYSLVFRGILEEIELGTTGEAAKVDRYVKVYADVLRGQRMCLCGMLAAEYTTLPEAMQDEIRRFFDLNEEWLTTIFEKGRASGELDFEGPARDVANLLLGTLEGAMLVARSYGDVQRFEAVAARLVAGMKPASRPPSAG